uniref:Uncharacterized protein n=1 Tax=Esox lucius TaxID=8010 RepID=A0A3P8Z197_ESOLU
MRVALSTQIHKNSHRSNSNNHLETLNLVRRCEPLDGFNYDGKAQGSQEHCVDQSTHHFGSNPSECICIRCLSCLREAHSNQGHNQSYDIRDHTADRNLNNEKSRSHGQHAKQSKTILFPSHLNSRYM